MIVIAPTNRKGGVGKSMLSEHLAMTFASTSNVPVLLIDMDGQANSTYALTQHLNFPDEASVMAVLHADDPQQAAQTLREVVVPSTWHPSLFVLPANPNVFKLGQHFGMQPGVERRLADALNLLRQDFPLVVIDTQPAFGLSTEMALAAATDIVIPVEPHHDELLGLYQLMRSLDTFRSQHNPALRVRSVVVNKFDARRSGHKNVLDQLQHHPQIGRLLHGVIPNNAVVPYAQHEHISVFDYAPRSEAAQQLAQYMQTLFGQLRAAR